MMAPFGLVLRVLEVHEPYVHITFEWKSEKAHTDLRMILFNFNRMCSPAIIMLLIIITIDGLLVYWLISIIYFWLVFYIRLNHLLHRILFIVFVSSFMCLCSFKTQWSLPMDL